MEENIIGSLSTSLIINPILLKKLARKWLEEDIPNFDCGGFILGKEEDVAGLFLKAPGVLAGVPFVNAVFQELDCRIQWLYPEGKFLENRCKVAIIRGKSRNLLLGERVALNCICRASGIATQARQLKNMAIRANWNGEIAGTRKTTPGFRLVEKYALLIGGVSTHRFNLSSMVMLKDNHILAAGSISKAVKAVYQVAGFPLKIEVECRSVAEALEAAEAGCDIVMLDNFDSQVLHEAAAIVRSKYPKILIEASGGVTSDALIKYMGPHINIISLGELTQGYKCLDFSMKLLRENHDPENPPVKAL